MRIISGQIASLLRNSKALSEEAKAHGMVRDIEHAKFFESVGARAVYCIDRGTTHLQFVGVHDEQRKAITAYLAGTSDSAEFYAISREGTERMGLGRLMNYIAHSTYELSGEVVLERAGPQIAQEMMIRETDRGVEVTFEAGDGYRASPSELAALRMIALHECMRRIGQSVQVTSLRLGVANVTISRNYKGPLKTIAGLGHGLPALKPAPAAKARAMPWYALA